jgi:hypothetical protein
MGTLDNDEFDEADSDGFYDKGEAEQKSKTGNGHSDGSTGAASPINPEVTVRGIRKRLTSLADLDRRFALLQAVGLPSVYISRPDFLPITDMDLRRRLEPEVVQTGTDRDGNAIYVPAAKFWCGHARQHIFRKIVFTNKPVADDCYNLFRGLGVTPAPGDCTKILAHIREVICSNVETDFQAMLHLLAWQIQHVGEPSRIIVVLHNPNQQAGKGIFFEEIMLKIYGPSGFSPSDTDQVLGRFNDTLRGCAFLMLDEVHFGHDLKAANNLKALATTTLKALETKGLPTILCQIAVNLFLLSNSDDPVHIEEGDARYWVLLINEARLHDDKYFDALTDEIEKGGREAFADFLLHRDVSKFVPKHDVPRDNEERRTLIKRSRNPYDAELWLEACAHTEMILGIKITKGDGTIASVDWETGKERSSGVLYEAYRGWQTTVKTRAPPKPTPSGSFGELLSKAGFGSRHTNKGTMRAFPDPVSCLEALSKLQEVKPSK